MNYLKTFISNIVKRAALTRPADDSKDYSIAQVQYFDKVVECEMVSPYGLFSNAPLNSHMLIFNVNALEENRAGIAYLHAERFKNLQPGEVQIGNPSALNYVKFDEDGNIEANAPGNITWTASGSFTGTITGNISFSTSGTATYSSSGDVEIKSNSQIIFKGNTSGQTFVPEVPNNTTASPANTFVVPGTGELKLSTSSKRFKQNIRKLDFSTSCVLKLKPKQFEHIEDKEKTAYNFIAEEVFDVFPEAVLLDKDKKPFALKGDVILMALVEEVKRLRNDVDNMKNILAENHG